MMSVYNGPEPKALKEEGLEERLRTITSRLVEELSTLRTIAERLAGPEAAAAIPPPPGHQQVELKPVAPNIAAQAAELLGFVEDLHHVNKRIAGAL